MVKALRLVEPFVLGQHNLDGSEMESARRGTILRVDVHFGGVTFIGLMAMLGAKPAPAPNSASHCQQVQSSPIVPKNAVSILNARLGNAWLLPNEHRCEKLSAKPAARRLGRHGRRPGPAKARSRTQRAPQHAPECARRVLGLAARAGRLARGRISAVSSRSNSCRRRCAQRRGRFGNRHRCERQAVKPRVLRSNLRTY